MLKKRGAQVTIFFILAMFIIVLGIVFLHFRSLSLEEEYVKPELVPVKAYIDNCISNVAETGIRSLGVTGGYIEIPERVSANPRSYLSLGPAGFLKMPYWWYDGVTAVPTENFIKRQLEDYINRNLRACLDNFDAFEGQYDVNELGTLTTEVILTDNDVLVTVNYPLEIFYHLNKTKLSLETFKQTIPIRLKKVFELAKTMMDRENKDFFLEKKTIDLMAMNREIPTTDVEATCEKKVWNLLDIKNKLKLLLRVNLPFIRINNAEYEKNIYVPTPEGPDIYENSYYQYHYVWEVSDEEYKDLSATFTYDENWPFDIDARPRKGFLLESNSMKGKDILKWFCLHIWHFTYDVIYPVKATIVDKATEKHKDYIFNFVFKVSIDHNQPNRVGFAHTIFDTSDRETNEDYCSDLSDEVTIYTVANATEPYDLNGVNLTLTCGAYTCPLGTSEYLSFGAASGIVKRMPYCVNAVLRGNKEGFDTAQIFIQTDAPRTYTLYLKPVKEFNNYRVVKHPFVDPASQENLKPSEKASIILKPKDADFESFGAYPTQGSFPIKLLADKEHTYDVTIYLVDGDDIAGGYKAEWTVSPDELKGSNQVVFHVLDQGSVSEEEKLLFLTGLESYSDKIPKPELK